MIVAVPCMDMMQAAIDQIIDMIAVRHRFMATARPMHMGTGLRLHAAIGIAGRNANQMLVNMLAVHMVQMAIMQIINMAIMLDRGVAAARAVAMAMIGVDVAAHHLAPCLNRRPARLRMPTPSSPFV
jgi:hypothetical protein